ncbi:ASKHA domain-containing protein [Parasporobacterium paucivorans]|uniref:Uncharacterized 2Fe-2 and 4Fe-4S clusters-containing protein, contains DUF4445 domain n=1 Tax=Parasporobacterium paucivorans DSM 15970 TaxID=1122934 RepID=A0A1M6IHJ3_9FIRM|nr:ASKHA domain-containing protein [Parasporobacterium paucivorans]SHJ33911.1 Uncharacterized 2Fe-2 and 4Fe-4S clusters-containing protein, contains DUF4445 domain [Parasporobacterium paucivorans DSM 15970]
MLCKIIFQPYGTKVEIQEGKTVLEAAREAGIHIPVYCGGGKTCGKCRIKAVEGYFEKHQVRSSMGHLSPLTQEERKQFSKEELASGYRLACAAEIGGDMVVEIPAESQIQPQIILEDGKGKEISVKPAVKMYYLELDKASLSDKRDDLTRVKDSLLTYKEVDGNPSIDICALRDLPAAIRKGGWKITIYILYGRKIIGVAPGRAEKTYGAAIDVGTTTVVAYLCDLNSGRTLQTGSFMNPQVRYGDDVISRISYCMTNPDGAGILRDILMKQLNDTLQDMASSQGIQTSEICEAVMVFNTVMESIALGIVPDALGVSPFVSPAAEALDIPARDLGIRIMPGGNVHCLPSEAGFVGADNVAVLIAEEPYKQDKMQLIIDIGTNSEICLGNREKLYSTSCATGPALEGAQIKCGMRAAKGAIEAVKIHPVTLEPRLKIIGEETGQAVPAGICGSGILDAVAQMASTGIIEPDGRFSSRVNSRRVRTDEKGKREYVLYFRQTPSEHDIVVTMADVRAVQLAKAALYAGAKTLMMQCGIARVDEVVLAGAFGNFIDRENALNLGLFPDCAYKNITVSGNAAGVGARMALLSTEKRAEAKTVAGMVEFVDTASEAGFSKRFTQAMFIPHKSDIFTANKPVEFPCPGIHSPEGNTGTPEYPYKDPAGLLEKEGDFISGSLLHSIILQNSRDNLPEGLLDLPGPFSVLGCLVSPVSLYGFGRKHGELLDRALNLIAGEIASYAKKAVENGIKIISYSDPAGVMGLAGESFYRKFSGSANRRFFKEMEPFLKESVIHLCGKTSYSMEKAGFMLARPFRTDGARDYMEILFEEAEKHGVKFIGHACINNSIQPVPVLYRMELL